MSKVEIGNDEIIEQFNNLTLQNDDDDDADRRDVMRYSIAIQNMSPLATSPQQVANVT